MTIDPHLLLAAGGGALAGLAIGLCIALLRAQVTRERLRRELQSAADELKSELGRASAQAHGLELELGQARARIAEQHRSLGDLREEFADISHRYHALQHDHVRLQTEHRERQDRHAEQVQLLNEARDNLRQEFENLANRIFEDRGRRFATANRESLEALLQPFREQISSFQSRVNEVHSESLRGHTALEKEIQKVLQIGLEMNTQASNLATALKGDKKTTGNWGEAQLQRTLELAGLQPGEHYETQAAFRDGEGRRRLPDFVIKLPDGKNLVIDSKVSLVDYDRAVAAETESERDEALDAHARAVRHHIDDLASKDYANLPGMESPDFVLMFMPVEPAYIEALKQNRDLFNHGYQKGVIMVSHTTLMPILRTVANLWMIDRSNREAREISSRAGEIFNQVCLVAERLNKLGNTLKAANNHYNDTVRGLAGKQGLYGKIERFQQLSARASKELAALDPIHADIENDRLELASAPDTPAATAEEGENRPETASQPARLKPIN